MAAPGGGGWNARGASVGRGTPSAHPRGLRAAQAVPLTVEPRRRSAAAPVRDAPIKEDALKNKMRTALLTGRRELLHELDPERGRRASRGVDDFPGQLYPLADEGREERVDSGQTVLRGERPSGG